MTVRRLGRFTSADRVAQVAAARARSSTWRLGPPSTVDAAGRAAAGAAGDGRAGVSSRVSSSAATMRMRARGRLLAKGRPSAGRANHSWSPEPGPWGKSGVDHYSHDRYSHLMARRHERGREEARALSPAEFDVLIALA